TRSTLYRGVRGAISRPKPAPLWDTFHRKRRCLIANVELPHLPSALDLAPFPRIEQSGRQAQHSLGHRAALDLVAVEQFAGSTTQYSRQLPAEIVGVLRAGIQTLRACRRMNVSGVPDQEDAANTVVISEPGVHDVG